MNKDKKINKRRLLAAAVCLAAGLFMYGCSEVVQSKNENDLVVSKLVECLSRSGAVIYFSPTCNICEAQKQIFGKEFDRLEKVNCAIDTDKCKGITGYPTWVVNEKKYLGYLNYDRLSKITNCQLNK